MTHEVNTLPFRVDLDKNEQTETDNLEYQDVSRYELVLQSSFVI